MNDTRYDLNAISSEIAARIKEERLMDAGANDSHIEALYME